MPCDMLFVKPEVLGVIKKTFHGQDAVLPMHSGLPRPLLGIYSGHRVAIMVERTRQRNNDNVGPVTGYIGAVSF